MSDAPLAKLIAWYQNHVKPFLFQHGPEKVQDHDASATRLERLQAAIDAPFPVCFLGNSGIGKSTLINALVFKTEIYIPAGGVGPLTAQALTVCYGEQPQFEVTYHNVQRIHQVIFGLQQSYLASLKRQGVPAAPAGDAEPLPLEIADEEEVKQLETFLSEETPERDSKLDELRKQAVLMVAGRQDAEREIPYLIDCLLSAYGKSARFGHSPSAEDDARIKVIASALIQGRTGVAQVFRQDSSPDFFEQLREHATGYLAPLIKDLTVRWNTELLKEGLTLVDLPGVGITGDVKAGVTVDYIREKAKGIVLVVSPRGIQQSDAELLRNSGFLNRLLHASDDPSADPVALMVAVTRVDSIAEDHYEQDRTKSKKRFEHFLDACAETQQLIRTQLRAELEKVWQSASGLSAEKQAVVDNLLARLQVFPVSALQYRRFHAQDMDNPWFIKDERQSNIPQMIECLQSLLAERVRKQQEYLEEEQSRFFRGLRARLEVIRSQWEQDLRASDEAESLRAELQDYIDAEKLDAQFSTRQGAYREFLKTTLPLQISEVVHKAAARARDDIYDYMHRLQGCHWATLKAAVVRGGVYNGSRHIELPKDIALRFEEPVAEQWGKTLLREIRKRTGDYAEDSVTLVEQILGWAKSQGARVRTNLLEAQLDVIREDAKAVTTVGKEAINELRQEVQQNLMKKIEGPIRRRCERFVKEGEHIGPGVKHRILDLFNKLAAESVKAATEPAVDLLTMKFREVEQEILEVFNKHQEHTNPVAAAVNAIVSAHERHVEREDRKRKQAVLEQLDAIEEAAPFTWESAREAQAA